MGRVCNVVEAVGAMSGIWVKDRDGLGFGIRRWGDWGREVRVDGWGG